MSVCLSLSCSMKIYSRYDSYSYCTVKCLLCVQIHIFHQLSIVIFSEIVASFVVVFCFCAKITTNECVSVAENVQSKNQCVRLLFNCVYMLLLLLSLFYSLLFFSSVSVLFLCRLFVSLSTNSFLFCHKHTRSEHKHHVQNISII